MAAMKITVEDGTAKVFTPYNPEFVRRIKTVGRAKWNGSEKCWQVSDQAVEAVREIMMDVYGETDIPDCGEKISVRVTFLEEHDELREAYTLFGKTIASAFGRDSGARTGEEAIFVQGAPRSGGSVKNWRTVIPKDCIVELHNVPKALVDANTDDRIEIQILESRIDKTALLAEKERLLKRLAEIEELLK